MGISRDGESRGRPLSTADLAGRPSGIVSDQDERASDGTEVRRPRAPAADEPNTTRRQAQSENRVLGRPTANE